MCCAIDSGGWQGWHLVHLVLMTHLLLTTTEVLADGSVHSFAHGHRGFASESVHACGLQTRLDLKPSALVCAQFGRLPVFSGATQ